MKTIVAIVFISFSSLITIAQSSTVISTTINSKILEAEKKYSIYLPAGYDSNLTLEYPVLYLLHGGGGSNTDWVEKGSVDKVLDELISSGQIQKMIIVMPDAGETLQTYFNDPEWRYEDFFFEEFIPYIESNYRIIGDKQHRAISGLSLGGQGTFVYAFRHPDLFSSAYAMSGYFYSVNLRNHPRDDAEWRRYQLLVEDQDCTKLVKDADSDKIDSIKEVKWFIDCGDEDFCYDANVELVNELRKSGVDYELRIRDGGHTWMYWNSALYISLPFINENFGI